jgi:hypothetical protein
MYKHSLHDFICLRPQYRGAGVKGPALLEIMQGRYEGYVGRQAIYNALQKMRAQYQGNRTDSEVLLQQLQAGNIPHEVRKTECVPSVIAACR